MSLFDRSWLPPADLEFVVMTDTHFMLDPGAQTVEFESRRRQAARAAHALGLVASLQPAFVVHLGDLIQEFPESTGFAASLEQALAQFAEHVIRPYQVAGNHDVGDKPDPTMPTDWVTAGTLAQYHERFGRSWYSWSSAGCHFVVLNSQIMNGPLPEVREQEQWLEDDLAAHDGMPAFLFLHLSPFLVREDEQGLGHYDNIDEPARSWLLGLVRKYQVQLVFSGHTHFTFFNRIGAARSRVVLSTAFTRPGFCEVFSSAPPPERGRDDAGKLGFLLVRVREGQAAVHLVRTNGAMTANDQEPRGERLVTRISPDLPDSPLGITLRHPLATATEVPIAWQSTIRQPVRNDYPLLACVELGARHVRLPSADLGTTLQRERLTVLRDEGVALTSTWIWSARSPVAGEAAAHRTMLDGVEVQFPGGLLPDAACLRDIDAVRGTGLPVTLAPLLPREVVPGKQHARTRIGYHRDELAGLDDHLGAHDAQADRVLCRVDTSQDPWDAIVATTSSPSPGRVGTIDWAVEFEDAGPRRQVGRAVRALAAIATLPGSRLMLEPLVDLDRTMDAPPGLLDRLCNPRPVFHAVRTLNTVLFSKGERWSAVDVAVIPGGRTIGLASPSARLVILLPDSPGIPMTVSHDEREANGTRLIELGTGMIRDLGDEVDPLTVTGPTALLSEL